MRKRRSYEGEIINGWLILDEINLDQSELKPNQRNRNRLFKVQCSRTGEILERKMSQMRMCAPTLLSEKPSFKDLTGLVINDWEILSLENDRLTIQSDPCITLWKVRSLLTGEIKSIESPLHRLPRLSHSPTNHNFRSSKATKQQKQTYSYWRRLISSISNPEFESYCNVGALGYTFDPSWIQFESFLKDLNETIGLNPDPEHPRKYRLVPIKGKEFRRGNLHWKFQHNVFKSFTHPDNK